MGNMCVSSCRCCVCVYVVHPVSILSAVFCVICSLLMFVSDAIGDHISIYVIVIIIIKLYFTANHFPTTYIPLNIHNHNIPRRQTHHSKKQHAHHMQAST